VVHRTARYGDHELRDDRAPLLYAPGNGAPDETTYEALTFGPTLFSGTGQFLASTQTALANEGHWYGYRGPGSSGAVDTSVITRTLSDSDAAKGQRTATYMTVSAGCYGATCTLGPTANVFLELYGSRVTITDNTAPSLGAPVAGSGLLAPGIRSGDEPVTFSASDNVGIRRAELVDVTDAANPAVVVAKDYNSTATAPERPLQLHQAQAVPGPQERDARRLARHRRQADPDRARD
jgi:hypothetical protein